MSSIEQTSFKNVKLSKGIILGFFTIFLIFYGIFITNFVEIYPSYQEESLPVFITYIPLVCYIGALFLGFGLIIFIRNATKQKSRVVQSRKKVKSGSIYKEALLLVIFILAFIPLLGPIFDQGMNDQSFSVYNNNWNGASDFKATIEQEGYNAMTVQSSLSATERLNKSILLILLGPNEYYNPIFEIPYFIDFFNPNIRNSLFICHDHGSTSTLLWEIFISSALDMQGFIPVTLFADGTLYDNDSFDTRPEFPVIRNFSPHPTTNGISNVILSQASTVVGGPFISYFGWDLVGYTTDYGYVDINGDKVYDFNNDHVDLSLFTGFGIPLPDPPWWPLGGYSQGIFMAKDSASTRVFLSSDASLFNNELLSHPDYDNLEFGINIINWLTFDEPKENWVVVFDEAHIRPEYSRDLTSAGIYGYFLQYIIQLSTNPITAWIYPILAVYTLKRYLPKKSEKEEKKKAEQLKKKEEKERFRTSSFFAEKIQWYREKGRYDKALTLLNRRLDRKLNALLRGNKITTDNVLDMVISKDPKITNLKIKRISRFMERILLIKEGKSKIRNEQEFEYLFFEMEWVVNNL
jgi:hypothetical protein